MGKSREEMYIVYQRGDYRDRLPAYDITFEEWLDFNIAYGNFCEYENGNFGLSGFDPFPSLSDSEIEAYV